LKKSFCFYKKKKKKKKKAVFNKTYYAIAL
jgi:hypothetical protein